jgi:hypothetical protein
VDPPDFRSGLWALVRGVGPQRPGLPCAEQRLAPGPDGESDRLVEIYLPVLSFGSSSVPAPLAGTSTRDERADEPFREV